MLFLWGGAICLFAQLNKANKFYENYNYANAIPLYEKIVKKKNNPVAIQNLANCYRVTKNYVKAEELFARAVQLENIDPINYFYYGEVLKSNGKFEEAERQFEKYSKLAPADKVTEIEIKSIDEIKKVLMQQGQYDVTNVRDLNTENSEFSPVYYKNGIVFVGQRNLDLINFDKSAWNNKSYYHVCYSAGQKDNALSFGKPKLFSDVINSIYHDGPVCFSSDQSLVYFTRIVADGKKEKNHINYAKMYSSKYENGKWTKLEPFYLNSNSFSVAHPSLSDDGQWLFFVSDMPGGLGGKDIYVCKKEGDKWGDPQNLGPDVNTPGNEVFPYIRKDGVLFFSSDGHGGFGGLDIFSAEKVQGKWTHVSNIGIALNSSTDDFGIIFEEGNKRGYFSSDRPGGMGSDDIYSFVYNPKTTSVSGKILLSNNTTDPAKNAKIILLREDGTVVKISTTDGSGFFKFENLPPDQNYRVKIDENDPAFVAKQKIFLADENNKIIKMVNMTEKAKKFIFQDLPVDTNALKKVLEEDIRVVIAGNILAGENPSKPLANTQVTLLNEKGEVVKVITTNAFGAFIFSDLPSDKKFSVKVDESDPALSSYAKIVITNKSGKEIKSTKAGARGDFKFEFLAADKNSFKLMEVEDTELRTDIRGSLLSENKKVLANSKVNLVNENGEIIQTTTTDALGKFAFADLPADKNYFVTFEESDPAFADVKKMLLTDEQGKVVKEAAVDVKREFKFELLSTDQKQLGKIYIDDPWLKVLEFKTKVSAEVHKDSITIIENIYYDYGKYELLPEAKHTLDKVIQIMKNDPHIVIELSSHTDSRSSDEFNMALSKKRAKTAVDYVISYSISPKRITGIGYGETRLINKCANGVECTEEEHAQNRRTEFKIMRK